MAAMTDTINRNGILAWIRDNWHLLALLGFMIALPFIAALLTGQSFGDVLANETGDSRFMQGLMIEIFILAIYALSFDLVLGVTGLLSFGHAMFFATGAYFTGIAFKKFGWDVPLTLLALVGVGVGQAVLFGLVLPRVKGITFALVTLGIASMFAIVVQSNELADWTGADVGLQGVIVPDFLSTSSQRFRLYIIALLSVFFVYLLYRRFVDSPTGHVWIAIRENEDRALMLGFNTFYFKLLALIVAGITAAMAGFLHTVHQPIVSPDVAGLGWTVVALLIILIGGVGTLSGAIIGAAVFRLLEYFLDKYFGTAASFLLGLTYIAIVLYLPYGIIGAWRLRSFGIAEGRQRLRELFRLSSTDKA